MPFDGKGTITFQHFKRLTNKDIQRLCKPLECDPHAESLGKIGRAFRSCILKRESFFWQDISFECLSKLSQDTLLRLLTVRRGDQSSGTWNQGNPEATNLHTVSKQYGTCEDKRFKLIGLGQDLASKQSTAAAKARKHREVVGLRVDRPLNSFK
ncbi:hypothetical protein F5883DRAFT_576006 [Diaporthe sp. PMI_573]|nr:hypothetical protein F5883DRAFT_576006 [Diaporthaceae sp. PMI_573]